MKHKTKKKENQEDPKLVQTSIYFGIPTFHELDHFTQLVYLLYKPTKSRTTTFASLLCNYRSRNLEDPYNYSAL